MAEPFLSEVRIMSFVFAPKGWALCNGQLLPINQNQGLFSLLGTTYGGDGRVNFALPDLRGRTPISMGNGYTIGERGGQEAHTITMAEMAAHSHFAMATSTAKNTLAANASCLLADVAPSTGYSGQISSVMQASMVGSVGGSQPHINMQPYLTLSFCIALQGIFPSQT